MRVLIERARNGWLVATDDDFEVFEDAENTHGKRESLGNALKAAIRMLEKENHEQCN